MGAGGTDGGSAGTAGMIGSADAGGSAADGPAGAGGAGGSGIVDAGAGDAGGALVLNGDGLAWSWNGETFLLTNVMTSWTPTSITFDAEGMIGAAMHTFMAGNMTTKLGTSMCSIAAGGFTMTWAVFAGGPPRYYGQEGLCEVTVTKSDPPGTPGSVFEATFTTMMSGPVNNKTETHALTAKLHVTKK